MTDYPTQAHAPPPTWGLFAILLCLCVLGSAGVAHLVSERNAVKTASEVKVLRDRLGEVYPADVLLEVKEVRRESRENAKAVKHLEDELSVTAPTDVLQFLQREVIPRLDALAGSNERRDQ